MQGSRAVSDLPPPALDHEPIVRVWRDATAIAQGAILTFVPLLIACGAASETVLEVPLIAFAVAQGYGLLTR